MKPPPFFIPPANEVAGPGYIVIFMSVRSFVRSFVRPSQSLIRYSSKTAEQNFMKLSGIVHYMMPYCTSYLKFLSSWFWGFPEQNKDFAITTYRITGFFCRVLFFVKFCGQVSTAKNSIAKNKLNTTLKLFTCRTPLLGKCRIWILTRCWVIQVHVPCFPLLYAKSCTLSYKISKK